MVVEKSEKDLLLEISEKLDRLIAAVMVQGKDQATQLKIFSALGIDSASIGAMMGMSASGVRTIKYRGKKGKQKKAK